MRAALSLDLDNKWSYMKTHGDPGWTSYPSYFDLVVPLALDVLDRLGLRITFFIVGRDAAMAQNRAQLERIAAAGHEIANHSFEHEPWMHRRAEAEIDDELARAEESIEAATGQRPLGFRGPGFTKSPAILHTLSRRGYRYDASALPTFIGPLARAYYFRRANLPREEREARHDLFGNFSDAFQSNRPHLVKANGRSVAEIPVTTMPGFRLPIHISYILYLATFSPRLARAYFSSALHLCKLSRTPPSILLHPLDFLSARECPELAFFPAMNLDASRKREIVLSALSQLARNFHVCPVRDLCP